MGCWTEVQRRWIEQGVIVDLWLRLGVTRRYPLLNYYKLGRYGRSATEALTEQEVMEQIT